VRAELANLESRSPLNRRTTEPVGSGKWWSGRHDAARQSREEAASLRAEKRVAYRDLIQTLDAWREVTVEIADGERKRRDWDAYWEAREACMKAGASLQLVGTDDMIEAASEAIEFLLGAARGLRATIPPEAQ
jgi:hypothetical protein